MSMNEMESKIWELDQGGIGLIERKKQGQGRPTRIYVKNFTLPPEPGQPRQSDQTPPEGPQTAESQPPRPLETSGLDSKFSVPNKTEGNQTDQNHPEASISPSSPSRASPSAGAHRRMRIDEMDRYRERIRENIGYPLLVQERPYDREEIDGYVELMAEICASRRAYTLAALYNVPVTISQYYAAQVSHDMAQLIVGKDFKRLSVEAKLLYGLLLDRMGLSAKSGCTCCPRYWKRSHRLSSPVR